MNCAQMVVVHWFDLDSKRKKGGLENFEFMVQVSSSANA